MGNEESKTFDDDEKDKRLHKEEISEERESQIHYRMSSSRKRSKTSSYYSRSRSRSSDRGRRARSSSLRRSPSRYKREEIEATYPDYYCKACDCYSSGRVSWNQHIVGRRHAKNTGCDTPEFYSSKRRRIERETIKRVHDYVPKDKLLHSDNVSQNMMETDQEDNNYVGLAYILVVHKYGKSVFQCFLCDTFTIYKNSQQLKDHVLGVNHQRAYEEEKHKSSIKIKRLKSRKPGKHSLEELVEQKLFSPNTAEKSAKKSPEVLHDSRTYKDSKSSKTKNVSASTSNKPKPTNFLRKTIEQVQLHNRKYELKMTSTTFHPERKLSTPVSDSAFSKNSTPSRSTTASPGCRSTASLSFKDIASLGNDSPVPSSKSVQTLLELVETLSTTDIFKLLLLKLKNVEIQKQDSPFLDEVAYETTALSEKLKKQLDNTLQKENLDEQEKIPLFIEVSNNYNSEKDATVVQNASPYVLSIDDEPNSIPFIDEAINLSTSGNNSSDLESSKVSEEISTPLSSMDQPTQLSAAFWNSLPSTKELANILSNLPGLNLSKNSDGIVEISSLN